MLPNKGFAELDRALALRPDIIKLGRTVIQAAEQTSTVAIVVYGLVNILHNAGVQVAIEGIETAKQLEIARRTGADLLQGFYLGKPEFAAKTRISA
jgi:EAL domain-containing protein (putative c-di-GMP-specific phosphodiesterase class I)